jgi:hypothetical protein
MISSPTADEAVITERFARDFGYEKPGDAVGKTIELLAAPEETKQAQTKEDEAPPNFFGIPLDDGGWMNRLPICKRTLSKLLGCSIPRSKKELGREDCAD